MEFKGSQFKITSKTILWNINMKLQHFYTRSVFLSLSLSLVLIQRKIIFITTHFLYLHFEPYTYDTLEYRNIIDLFFEIRILCNNAYYVAQSKTDVDIKMKTFSINVTLQQYLARNSQNL